MGRIYTLHGVSSAVDERRFIYRNMSDLNTLTAILRTSPKFVRLDSAIDGNGDALTIDDATRAGAEAALLARAHGHEVTLFVNPDQVELGAPHSFHLLSALIEGIRKVSVIYRDLRVTTLTRRQRHAVRNRLKEDLRDTTLETDRQLLIHGLAKEWGVELKVPSFLETLSLDDLKSLQAAGVDIGNHGWSHACHKKIDAESSNTEIERGHAWLAENLGVDAAAFAVPFGDVLPKAALPRECSVWLTVDDRHPSGWVADGVWNRDTLEAQPQRSLYQRAARTVQGVVRRTRRRISASRKTTRGERAR